MVEVRLVYNGEEKALQVPADGELELDKIGQELFSLYPHSVNSSLGRRPSVRVVAASTKPLELVGGKGPFHPGFEAKLLLQRPSPRPVFDRVRIRARLYWDCLPRDVHAYRIALENEEPLTLKLYYNAEDMLQYRTWPYTFSYELRVLLGINKLREEQGLKCHSLPMLVEHGALVPGQSWRMINALVITPCVPSIPLGKAFSGRQLCNAAFDILLAIYHLQMFDRDVRCVLKCDVLFVEQDEVFVLANLGRIEFHEEEGVHARGLLWPASLVLTLAALGGMAIVGSDEKAYGCPDPVEVAAAAARLRQEHPLLGDFADALGQLEPIYGQIDYDEWLHALVKVSDRSPGMIRKHGLLETWIALLSCAS